MWVPRTAVDKARVQHRHRVVCKAVLVPNADYDVTNTVAHMPESNVVAWQRNNLYAALSSTNIHSKHRRRKHDAKYTL